MRKKILIFGPIGDVGGRELETGFIASTLSEKYSVDVISSRNPSKLSQILFFKGFHLASLNGIIFKKNLPIKFCLKILSFFKKTYKYNASNVSNPFIKSFFNLELKKKKILENNVKNVDIIFICAQVTSPYVEYVINFAKNYNKKVIFRTTGYIEKGFDIYYLKYINLFIHHSKINASQLRNFYNYKIIDQCSFNESNLLNIPIVKEEVHNFMTVSRIDKTKNIDVVINAFIQSKDTNDRLYIVGSGPYLEELKSKTNDKRIIFTGFIPNNELQKIFTICQCFIVSYYKLEAGPITGIEAMASGKIIISSKTGAMPERLLAKDMFWHNNQEDNLFELIQKVKQLDYQEIAKISKSNRERYMEAYSEKNIQKEYLKVVDSLI